MTDITAYFGRSLTPAFIPHYLAASKLNGYAQAVFDKKGTIVEDAVWMQFYHSFDEDGYPLLTENIPARKGFVLKAAKISDLNDCIYVMHEDEVKSSTIGNIDVIVGYR